MGAMYDAELLEKIARGTRVEEVDGLKLEFRPVPDDDRPHTVDPRVDRNWNAYLVSRSETATPEERKAAVEELSIGSVELDGVDVVESVREVELPGRTIPVHLIRPAGQDGPLPVVFYLHGGGFAYGHYGMYRDTLKALSSRSNAVIVFPDYRLAPDDPFPAAVEDCEGVILWALDHADELGLDTGRIVVAGDSAGGSLSSAMAIRLRGVARVGLLVLLYPLTYAGPVPKDWSYDLFPHLPEHDEQVRHRIGRMVDAQDDLAGIYTQGSAEALLDPQISALTYEGLGGFPRTVMVTCEFDYLREQGEDLARKIVAAGGDARCIRYGGTFHAFAEKCGIFVQVEDLVGVICDEMARL